MTVPNVPSRRFALPLSPPTAAPVVYVSPFRRLLERGQWAALAVLLLWALCCFWALRAGDVATRVIGHDTAPSITAAESIRSLLADANGNLANIMLTNASSSGEFAEALRVDISEAEAKLVDAAQNITYGDAEKIPITTIMRGVAQYDELVGEARALGSAPKALEADDLMRRTILPATEALDQANDDQLTASYASYQKWKFWQTTAVSFVSFVSLLALLSLQYRIYAGAKRVLNPGLAASTVVVALASVYALIALGGASGDLKTAKSDAFDSIYALTTLQAVANDANATESFWLVAYDDASKRATYEDLFKSLSHEIVGIDSKDALAAETARRKFPGLLGDELSNITFVGELRAAETTLKTWAAYVAIDGQLRALQNAGKRADAVALDVGEKPGQSNWAFGQFQKSLQQTIKINQDAFDAAIRRSEEKINMAVYGVLFLAWLVASAAAWYGVRLRLREYEF